MSKSVKKADWFFLAASVATSWWLIKLQNRDNPNLEVLRTWLRAVWWAEIRLARMEKFLKQEIDKELDSYGG